MVVMKCRTTMFNDSLFISLSQYLKKLYKTVSTGKSNLKFGTVISTKDTHQIPKNQISVAETLTIFAAISKMFLKALNKTLDT